MGKRTRAKSANPESATKFTKVQKSQHDKIKCCTDELKHEQRKLADLAASCPEIDFDKESMRNSAKHAGKNAGRCIIFASRPDTGKSYTVGEFLKRSAPSGLIIVGTKVTNTDITNPNLP